MHPPTSVRRRSVLAASLLAAMSAPSLAGTPTLTAPPAVETASALPIVGRLDTTEVLIRGTAEATRTTSAVSGPADIAQFRFPATLGHLRAYPTSHLGAPETYAGASALFDAATMIPPVSYTGCGRFDSSCRTVFTTVAAGAHPARVMLEEKTLGVVGPLLAGGARLSAADQRVLLHRVLAGREVAPNTYAPALGGIDRSTVAVVPKSPLTRGERPTMIYVGAADGMLHAICASVQAGVCDRAGRELWAYVPRSLLPALRTGAASVEGSPHVVEVMGDFAGTGHRSLRTVLLFSTGATAAVHALDVTDPADPTVIWEYTPPRADVALGLGRLITSGRLQLFSGPKVLAYAQTTNGGTGAAGTVVTAIDVETGRVAWQAAQAAPRSGELPGGIAVATAQGQAQQVVFGTPAGALWVLDAATGANRRHGPAFQFSSAKHPFLTSPALYANADGAQYALAVSGASGAARTQYAIAISLTAKPNPAPLDEESADSTRLPIVLAFDARTSSQPVVAAKQLAFAADGKAFRVSFATNTIATTEVPAGSVLASASFGWVAAGTNELGRVETAQVASSHTVATAATDDDLSWY